MTRNTVIQLLAISAQLSSTCSAQQSASSPRLRNALRHDLLGCYALFTDRGHPIDTSFYNASPMVLLDSTPADRDSAAGIMRIMFRLDSTGRSIAPRRAGQLGPSWGVDSTTDTLRLSFADGFSGAGLSLLAQPAAGDTLHGRIEEDWDSGPPFVTDRGKGYAVRIPCKKL
jgi:hypothetical protein